MRQGSAGEQDELDQSYHKTKEISTAAAPGLEVAGHPKVYSGLSGHTLQ
jgi:hypothetical protein